MSLGSEKEFLQSESRTSQERATWQCGQCKYSEYFQESTGSRVGQQKIAVNSSPDIYKYKYKYLATIFHTNSVGHQVHIARSCYLLQIIYHNIQKNFSLFSISLYNIYVLKSQPGHRICILILLINGNKKSSTDDWDEISELQPFTTITDIII